MDVHPVISENTEKIDQFKIILGSFPTWSICSTNNSLDQSKRNQERIEKGEIQYHYGSKSNLFWSWYKHFVDPTISLKNVISIKSSLSKNDIGITDMILRCERKGKSALDKHLTSRKYNDGFFALPEEGSTLKILCTSKGVMNDMFLRKQFFTSNEGSYIDEKRQRKLQLKLLSNSKVDLASSNPVCQVVVLSNDAVIECVATPSPGSPYRRLVDFGRTNEPSKEFLNSYLKSTFNWFLE